MLDFCLSPISHHNTLEAIKSCYLSHLTPSTIPTIHIILGQTGSGKSTLAQQLLKILTNTLIIDRDIYKNFNPLSKLILQHTPTYYGHLTGIDSYLHRQAMLSTAIARKYNILIQLAPSQNNLLNNLDLKKLQDNNYKIHLHILAVSLPNILLSIHERYENQLMQNHPTPKLTDLNRALDSHNSLLNCLPNLQTLNPQNMTFYTRNYSQNNIYPPLPTNNTTTLPKKLQNFTPHTIPTNNFPISSSTLINFLLKLQNYDLTHSSPQYNQRITTILKLLSNRHAPPSQIHQFHQILDLIASTPIPLK